MTDEALRAAPVPAGIIDDTLAKRPHRCKPPKIRELLPPTKPGGWPRTVLRHPPDTRFHCDCGRVQVVHYVQGGRQGRGYVSSGHVWQPETRRERRKRLGLRWWQRSKS